MDRRALQDFALTIAPSAAAVANYCDHVEHNEAAERSWVLDAGTLLRRESTALAHALGSSIVELYAERLGAIEARNVLARPRGFDGHAAALAANTWRDLQLVQVDHDRAYHLDVVGLAKSEQLRHYALHIAKGVGAFADPDDFDDLLSRRLPDVFLFGLKLPTVLNVRLSDEELPRLSPVIDDAVTRVTRDG